MNEYDEDGFILHDENIPVIAYFDSKGEEMSELEYRVSRRNPAHHTLLNYESNAITINVTVTQLYVTYSKPRNEWTPFTMTVNPNPSEWGGVYELRFANMNQVIAEYQHLLLLHTSSFINEAGDFVEVGNRDKQSEFPLPKSDTPVVRAGEENNLASW